MKKMLLSALVGFALIAIAGCTNEEAHPSPKCQAKGKCAAESTVLKKISHD